MSDYDHENNLRRRLKADFRNHPVKFQTSEWKNNILINFLLKILTPTVQKIFENYIVSYLFK